METELLDIQPKELKFTFELKKQSSCFVQLVNKSNQYVAFKVKTTAPKKYCVRPNTGIVLPRSKCDFTVTMQAQKEAPADFLCKDKFLVQSTIVPFGTNEEDLSTNLFSKEHGRFIEENKLRVILVSPPNSPVLLPINGALKQDSTSISPGLRESPVLKERPILNESPILRGGSILKENPMSEENAPLNQNSGMKENAILKESPARNDSPIHLIGMKYGMGMSKEMPLEGASDIENLYQSHVSSDNYIENSEADDNHSRLSKISGIQPLLFQGSKETAEKFNAKINHLESKLEEAEKIISRLLDEKTSTMKEKEKLQKEVVLLRRKSFSRVQVGFPFLFVCFVALVSMAVGYLVHS